MKYNYFFLPRPKMHLTPWKLAVPSNFNISFDGGAMQSEQKERYFFDDTENRELPDLPERPSKNQLIEMVNSPDLALNKNYIVSDKNKGAIHSIKLKLLKSFDRYNHSLGCSIVGKQGYTTESCAIVGESSTGKTHLARLLAQSADIPFVEIQPHSVETTHDIFSKIKKEFSKSKTPLVELRPGFFRLPPCIVFIDEVHELRGQLKNGEGLLNAMEPTDAILQTVKNETVDCFNVCWIVATTEIGKLFHAFKTRLDIIHLHPPGLEEVAKIIQIDNSDWNLDLCRLIAKYCRVPREAKRFASDVRTQHDFFSSSWEDAARHVANSKGYDEYGMHLREVNLLKALLNGPVGKNNLPSILQCQLEEIENDILPPLMRAREDRPALVMVTRRGVSITEAGIQELTKRGIAA